MSRNLSRLSTSLLALGAFGAAGLAAFGAATWAVGEIERRSVSGVEAALADGAIHWAEAEADGLEVTLIGEAPTEAERFRALSLASAIVDPTRIIDSMAVADAKVIAAPRFSVQILRSDAGISLIGLLPDGPARDILRGELAGLNGASGVTDMLEAAAYPAPQGWDQAIRFGADAVRALPRSKVSIDADGVTVTAIADSDEQRRQLADQLRAKVPAGLVARIDISAPRPVIAPFTLRLVRDESGTRFDACSADTETAAVRITNAATVAGVPGPIDCRLGLGVPSKSWAEAAEKGIQALAGLPAGTLTISDVDVTLEGRIDTPKADFDRVAGDLQAALPQLYSLTAVLPRAPEAPTEQGPVEFTAELDHEGKVVMRGLLAEGQQRQAVDAYAKSRFGSGAVSTATRPGTDLPQGWPIRVLAGLEALSRLHDGRVTVTPDGLEVNGVSGQQDARAAIAGLLSERLGKGASYRIFVRYDEALDPLAALPTPQECVATINTILASHKVTFSPGSATIEAGARQTLDRVAEAMVPCIDVKMEIGGHTDSQGRDEMNLQLSQARAESVLEALLARRVPVANLTAMGYGETLPIADNGNEDGREANRRIEFKLMLGEGAASRLPGTKTPEFRPADDAATGDSSQTPPAEGTEGNQTAETSGGEGAATDLADDAAAEEPVFDEAPMDDIGHDEIDGEASPDELIEGETAPTADASDLTTAPDASDGATEGGGASSTDPTGAATGSAIPAEPTAAEIAATPPAELGGAAAAQPDPPATLSGDRPEPRPQGND